MIGVLIVSDVRLYRDGLAEMLARDARISLLGTAASAHEGAGAVARLSPQVVLVNVSMENGLVLTRSIRSAQPDAAVVALPVPDDEHDVIAWAEAGAAGFVTAEQSVEDVIVAVESAARGEVSCSPWLAGVLLRRVEALAEGVKAEERTPALTSRELEVAGLLDRGLSNKEIARELFIEVATVKNHVHQILEKLSVQRRGDVGARMRQQLLRN